MEVFKTSHMGIAAYLKYMGVKPTSVQVEGDSVTWTFPAEVQEHVDTYNDSRATVNPKIYNKVFSLTRQEMFDMRRPNQQRRNDGDHTASNSSPLSTAGGRRT